MVSVLPLHALRPDAAGAPRVAAPPYDVVDSAEARRLAHGRPDSFLHVSRPEIDLPVGIDEHAQEVHDRGRANLDALVVRGALTLEAEPRLYLYAQAMGGHRQVGVVGCVTVREYLDGSIRKHENTRPDKELDRTRHIDTLGAHDEPVFLTYRCAPAIDAAVRQAQAAPPELDFATADGVRHTLWVLPRAVGQRIEQLFAQVAALYVADGHHRSAAAARVHELRRGQDGEHDRFPAVLFPHDQVQILPYNRLARDPAARSADELVQAIGRVMDLAPADRAEPGSAQSFGLYIGSRWYRARARRGSFDGADPVASLDCQIVQDLLFEPLFAIADPRRDDNIAFVGGIRGAEEIERRVAAEGWSIGVCMHPCSVAQLIEVSDAGLLMPPKSTWFEPKLASGLFVHRF